MTLALGRDSLLEVVAPDESIVRQKISKSPNREETFKGNGCAIRALLRGEIVSLWAKLWEVLKETTWVLL